MPKSKKKLNKMETIHEVPEEVVRFKPVTQITNMGRFTIDNYKPGNQITQGRKPVSQIGRFTIEDGGYTPLATQIGRFTIEEDTPLTTRIGRFTIEEDVRGDKERKERLKMRPKRRVKSPKKSPKKSKTKTTKKKSPKKSKTKSPKKSKTKTTKTTKTKSPKKS
jgi:hypothetical protein